MSYMWNDFNIKTFPAETIVYRDGVYCAELSTLPDGDINTQYDLPVHIIYFGEIAGKNELNINVNAQKQLVCVSVNVKNKLPAFFNIFIKNAGKNSEIWCDILMENSDNMNFDVLAHHTDENTGIFVKNRIICRENSKSRLTGTAMVMRGAKNAKSDITFAALAHDTAQITFAPNQKISAIPEIAGHAASIYHATAPQIQYLRMAGLGGGEINDAMRDAFMGQNLIFPISDAHNTPQHAND